MEIRSLFRLYAIAGWVISLIVCARFADAQSLTWGVNGAGGSGNWDATTANWFNGSQNVAWPSGGDAIFGGASAGTVNSYFPGPVVNSITFNTPGYTVQNGFIQSGANGLSVITNVDATIGSTLERQSGASFGGPSDVLNKTGSAALIINGTTGLDTVQINQGELRITGFGDLGSSDVVLADAPGVTLTLARLSSGAFSMHSLAGGGISGGVVQPNNQARTTTLNLENSGTFGGTLQDNGSGILALQFSAPNATESLTNANTYSGPTTISEGTIAFSGNGSALNSAISIHTRSALLLDNSSSILANRISDSAPVSLTAGAIQLNGNATTPVEEIAGPLTLSGVSSITVAQPSSAAAQLTFSTFQRNGHAILNIVGPGVKLGGLSNGGTGIVAPFITTGNDWMTVGSDSRLIPFNTYSTDINSGSMSDHVGLNGGGTIALATDALRASLNLQNSSTSSQVLDQGGHSLELMSGGILSSGTGATMIHGGTLSTPSQEFVVTASNNLTIDSKVVDASASTAFTKSGAGTLTLTGANSYSGPTAIMQGTLVVSSDANLGSGSTIDLTGGTLKAAGNFSSAKGFTGNSGILGSIDTGGFNIAFSGANNGAQISKHGLGNLTLATGFPGNVSVDAGVLVLPNTTSGTANLFGGTLQVAGTLSSLNCTASSGIPILDLGGPAAATVTANNFDLFGNVRVNFGIGNKNSDFLAAGQTIFPTNGKVQFEFTNLGGVRSGVDYPLMSYSTFSIPPSPSIFTFASDMAAAGWAGTFKTTTTGVSVRFTSMPVPEPGATFLFLQAAIISLAVHRRFFMRRPIS